MLVLPTRAPTTPRQLKEALTQALAEFVTIAPGSEPVQIVGEFPAMESLAIDLSRSVLRPPQKIPGAIDAVRVTEVAVGKFTVVADPLRYGQLSATLHVVANNVRLAIGETADAQSGIDLLGAERGHARLQTTRRDLESLAQSLLADIADKQGAKVEKVELTLTQSGPRSGEAIARVTLKKMFFTAKLRVAGKLAVDEALSATLSNLSCQGDGPIGSMAAGVIAPKLKAFEGRSFPLGSFAFRHLHIGDVRFTVGETITIEANL